MKLIDRIALNRFLSILTNFILGVLKILAPKTIEDKDNPNPPRKRILPWRK